MRKTLDHRISDIEEAVEASEPKKPVKSFLMILDGEDEEAKIAEFRKENGCDPRVILTSRVPRPGSNNNTTKIFVIGRGYVNPDGDKL